MLHVDVANVFNCQTPLVSAAPFVNAYSTSFVGASDQYVSLGDVLGPERDVAKSISVWFKTANTTVQKTLISKLGNGGTYTGWQFAMYPGNGRLVFLLSNDYGALNYLNIYETVGNWHNNAWHHACLTYSGNSDISGAQFYVDGALRAKAGLGDASVRNTLSASVLNAVDCQIGRRQTVASGLPFTGNIDEVAHYDKVLSLAEVQAIYNAGVPVDLRSLSTGPNLQLYLRMGDDDVFPTIVDLSTSGFDGTMVNMLAANFVLDVP